MITLEIEIHSSPRTNYIIIIIVIILCVGVLTIYQGIQKTTNISTIFSIFLFKLSAINGAIAVE